MVAELKVQLMRRRRRSTTTQKPKPDGETPSLLAIRRHLASTARVHWKELCLENADQLKIRYCYLHRLLLMGMPTDMGFQALDLGLQPTNNRASC